MDHSFSHKGRRIDVQVVERAEQFEWSFKIDDGPIVRRDEFVSRSSASAVLAAMAAAKQEIDRSAGTVRSRS